MDNTHEENTLDSILKEMQLDMEQKEKKVKEGLPVLEEYIFSTKITHEDIVNHTTQFLEHNEILFKAARDIMAFFYRDLDTVGFLTHSYKQNVYNYRSHIKEKRDVFLQKAKIVTFRALSDVEMLINTAKKEMSYSSHLDEFNRKKADLIIDYVVLDLVLNRINATSEFTSYCYNLAKDSIEKYGQFSSLYSNLLAATKDERYENLRSIRRDIKHLFPDFDLLDGEDSLVRKDSVFDILMQKSDEDSRSQDNGQGLGRLLDTISKMDTGLNLKDKDKSYDFPADDELSDMIAQEVSNMGEKLEFEKSLLAVNHLNKLYNEYTELIREYSMRLSNSETNVSDTFQKIYDLLQKAQKTLQRIGQVNEKSEDSLIGRQIYRVILPPFQAQLQIYREAQKDPAAYARNYDDLLGLKLALHNEDYTKAQQYKRNILARDKDFKF